MRGCIRVQVTSFLIVFYILLRSPPYQPNITSPRIHSTCSLTSPKTWRQAPLLRNQHPASFTPSQPQHHANHQQSNSKWQPSQPQPSSPARPRQLKQFLWTLIPGAHGIKASLSLSSLSHPPPHLPNPPTRMQSAKCWTSSLTASKSNPRS